MANMSYCRHENTLNDLRDVYEKWYGFDEEEASKDERIARNKIRELIIEMAEDLI